MMDQAIRDFAKQFEYQPEIVGQFQAHKKFLVSGMGGSHLGADIVQTAIPDLDLIIHRDYDLPKIDWKDRLFIASSYSGNTEEVVDGLKSALDKKLSVAAIAVGGQLIESAKENNIPYVQMPDTGIQPRSALGFSFLGLLKLMSQESLLTESAKLSSKLKPTDQEAEGKALAEKLKGKVPVVYASNRNLTIAYNWKIKLNETGKIPAFYNVFPELNHNEMTGFDVKDSSRELSEKFHFIFLQDSDDHPRVQKRMEVLKKQLEERGLPVETINIEGSSRVEKIFTTLPLADWMAFHTAAIYGLESEQVPMIEEFKKLIT